MRRMPCDIVVAEASKLFAVNVTTRARQAEVVHARHATAMVLRHMRHSWPDIGRALHIDHSSAIRGVRDANDTVRAMAHQLAVRLGVDQRSGPDVAELRLSLASVKRERDHLASEVARLSKELTDARQAAGLFGPRPVVRAVKQTLGSLVVERLPDGRVVTTKRVA